MKHFLAPLCLLGSLIYGLTQCTAPTSDVDLIFNHLCFAFLAHSQTFILSSYRRFQLMRFTVDQINNSTSLLPNVSLGYEIFDHCSDTHNFPGILKLISVNDLIQPWGENHKSLSQEVIAVVGPFSSTDTLTVAPFFMMNLFPVVSYGAASSAFSKKAKFPSFLRTVNSNKKIIEVIVNIIQYFKWRWVAFLNSDNDFGIDGLDLFMKRIVDTEICLAYNKGLNGKTNYPQIFQQIESQGIQVVIVFVTKLTAEALIESAMQMNVTNKVWIAGDTWSLNERLPKMKEIKNIGTVIGVSQPVVPIPGFNDFIYSIKSQPHCENKEQSMLCNQVCNCSSLSPEDVVSIDPSFSFPVYSAVYAIAHALHKVLKCGVVHDFIFVYPCQVLAELKKSNFTLLNRNIEFDEFGDPTSGSYDIVYWNQSGDVQEIGFYKFHPSVNFFINSSKIQWYTNGEVSSFSFGGTFHLEIAATGENQNIRNMPYCFPALTFVLYSCKDTEWSAEGSTSCNLRLVEFIPFTDSSAIVIMLGAVALEGLTLVVSVLFAVNYNTPVVRSAGGPMCFLILGCLSLCSISVFFYFGKPSVPSCVLRFLPFFLFYAVYLPKNYNEAKAITFCLLLLILTWILFATEYMLYRGKYIHTFNALAVLSSLYSFLLWYFLPKCYIIILQPHKNTPQYFQGLIQNYTKTISQ
uniref:Taste receptor type 1 member 1-like n=1 Tax=Stegastes partitus TaxID=144197 RepID=A0A3B5BIF2_9TELE